MNSSDIAGERHPLRPAAPRQPGGVGAPVPDLAWFRRAAEEIRLTELGQRDRPVLVEFIDGAVALIGHLTTVEQERDDAQGDRVTQRLVADAFKAALADDYRPHVEQNAAYAINLVAVHEELNEVEADRQRLQGELEAATSSERRAWATAEDLECRALDAEAHLIAVRAAGTAGANILDNNAAMLAHLVMDTPEDQDRTDRIFEQTRRCAAGLREAVRDDS